MFCISLRKGPVKVGSAKMDHLLKVQGAFRQPFHIHLEIYGGGIRVQVSDDIRNDRERSVLLQKDACHGMAEAVHPPVFTAHGDMGFYHICPDQLVQMVPFCKGKERGRMTDKDTAAVNLRPPIFQVIDHCPAHIRDKRQFHGLPCFGLGKTEFFLCPVEVFKEQVFDVCAAQPQTARNQDDGIVALAFRASPGQWP